MDIWGISEPVLRLGVFAAVLLTLVGAEAVWPRRGLLLGRRRWPTNLSILVLGGITVRVLGAISPLLLAVGAATWAQQAGVGLFNVWGIPGWLAALLCVLILDALIWAQHWTFHRVPTLWRLHRVHHADRDFDVTTALRFHPVEIALSMLIKVAAVVVLGAPVLAVVVFEVLLNACAMFNHANLRLPVKLDRVLRMLVVTPDMHRVHHSVHAGEHNRNFGFNLSVWDRWFGTYVAQPRDGHQGMTIGLSQYQQSGPERLGWSLWLPATPLLSRRDLPADG